MPPFHRPDPARRRLRLPRRTARLRLTALYGGLFLGCGSILLAVTYVLVEQAIDPPDFCARLRQLASAPVVDACSQRRSTQLATVLAKEIAGSDLRQVLIQAPAALAMSPPSPSPSAGSWPAGCCARWPRSPPPPAGSRPATCTSAWHCWTR